MDERARRRIERNRDKLEQWKRSKEETKALMKKITKPPFRPVGKAPINNYEGGLNKYLGSTPVSTTRSQGSSRKKSSTYSYKNQSKFTSTPFHKTRESKPSAFPKINILKSPRRGTFDIQTPISIPKSKLSQNKTKSVKFDDSIVKISPNVNESYRKSLTPNATHLTIDELRRVSNAGRTPFSCTTSRSGSTPGRKDFPSTITQIDDTCDSAKSPRSPKNTSTSKLNRSKSSKLGCVPRWSLKKGSIIERDPYLLRERTPINRSRIDTTPKTSKTPNRSIGSRVGSTKKKNLKVNFADVLVNTFDSNPALTPNDTINILKSELSTRKSDPCSPLIKTASKSPTLSNKRKSSLQTPAKKRKSDIATSTRKSRMETPSIIRRSEIPTPKRTGRLETPSIIRKREIITPKRTGRLETPSVVRKSEILTPRMKRRSDTPSATQRNEKLTPKRNSRLPTPLGLKKSPQGFD